jgi:hypothetical protein
MPIVRWRACIVALAFALAAQGAHRDTSPGLDFDALPLFPMARIWSNLPRGDSIRAGGITATRDDDRVLLQGPGWEVSGCSSCFVDAYRADLDGNGTLDYAFFGGGPLFNGRLTPTFSITILLMDETSRPVPFLAYVYHFDDGIRRLVDLDRDGRAELLVSQYDEYPSDPLVGYGCSGHWVTQLYGFRDLRTEEVRGSVGGVSFPFIKDWSYRGTLCDVVEGEQTDTSPPNLENRSTADEFPGVTRVRGQADLLLLLDPLAGCPSVHAKAIVYDQPNRRQVSILNLTIDSRSPYAEALAAEIQRDQAAVRLAGVDGPFADGGNCHANLLWATTP